jgi:prepilin-type N-terminal cleavage/methylation domain-containing protein
MMRHLPLTRSIQTDGGFTLVELLITITVTAILAGIAVPSFVDTIRDRRTAGAAENLAATLRSAQQEAIKRHKTVVVAFVGSGSTTWCWGVSEGSPCTCDPDPAVTNAGSCNINGTDKVVKGADYKGIQLDATTTFRFNPIRNTVEDGNVTFTGANGKKGRVVVSGSVGRIRFCTPSSPALLGYPAC